MSAIETGAAAMKYRVLTEAAQADRDEFNSNYKGESCRCFISPPCNWCVHPGNPDNQIEDDDCWEFCQKCGGHGLIGGMTVEGGDGELCPDCVDREVKP